MNIYKAMLDKIIEPILSHDKEQLDKIVIRLKQADGESWAVGEMLNRVLACIEATEWLNRAKRAAPKSGPIVKPGLNRLSGERWDLTSQLLNEEKV